MKIVDARFVVSASDARAIPADGSPHIALVGRSNVGKSTLINALAQKSLARTSAAPGKTRLANLYRLTIDGGPGGPGRWSVCFADLPGYGYARGGRESVNELARVAASYFVVAQPVRPAEVRRDAGAGSVGRVSRPDDPVRPPYRIAGVLHLVDARHPELESDRDAADWLASLGVERMLVATKVDKLSRRERAANLGELERKLGMAATPVSAPGGEGLDELWRQIARLSKH